MKLTYRGCQKSMGKWNDEGFFQNSAPLKIFLKNRAEIHKKNDRFFEWKSGRKFEAGISSVDAWGQTRMVGGVRHHFHSQGKKFLISKVWKKEKIVVFD